MAGKKSAAKSVAIIISLAALFLLYYIYLPAFNIHSRATWIFIAIVLVTSYIILFARSIKKYSLTGRHMKEDIKFIKTKSKFLKIEGYVIVFAAVFYILGVIFSIPMFNAKRYYNLMTVEKSTFAKDIKPTNFNTIPLLDKDSASLLGDREMGSMMDMVSQFEIGDAYSQINVNGTPVRVSPLKYAGVIKWIANQRHGVPGYVSIDMTTQNAEIVKLKEGGIKYSNFELFNRRLVRHLRFKYPTYIFFEQQFFEVDDEGTPYYICPVKKFNVGLFGGVTVGKVVICNAQTGECKSYDVKDVPQWVDKVFSAELLINLYNYHGMLGNGFLNSILSQKGCLHSTNGYNYIALDDDVWVYTGVTSAAADQAIVGFVLMNQRTMETKFYSVEGAIEDSAMASAEGQVQNLHYQATFPLLVNVSGRPTYFMALKDSAGLVKKYALVNVEKYQLVAIGDSINECKNAYASILLNNGIKIDNNDTSLNKITGYVDVISPVVLNGNTHYFIMLDNSSDVFDVDISNIDLVDIIKYKNGDRIELLYSNDNKIKQVKEIK